MTLPMSPRCQCGHNLQRHQVPGFDGECVADGCRCMTFRPIDVSAAPRRVQVAAPPRQPLTIDRLLAVAHASSDKRCALLAEKISHELNEIRARLAALRAQAAAATAQAQIAELPRPEKVRADGTVPVLDVPCSRDGCDRAFASGQARAMHERRAHDGFDPNAAKRKASA